MNSNNGYQPRPSGMSNSNMYFPSNTTSIRRDNPFAPNNNPFENFQRDKNSKNEEFNSDNYPRALASQSMISTNTSSSSGRRPTFGLLDSMARNVTTTFKDEALNQANNKRDNQFVREDNVAQSMVGPQGGFSKTFYGFNKNTDSKKLNTEPSQPVKKRRESIDNAYSNRRQGNSEVLPFLRRTQQPKESTEPKKTEINKQQVKSETHIESDFNMSTLEALKQKQFQFLRKRKQNQVGETANSMIPGANNMKNPQQFNNVVNSFKNKEYLSPTATKPDVNDVKCPQDKFKRETPVKNEPVYGNTLTPNFEFKKKKFVESPIEPASGKPFLSKDLSLTPRDMMTAKDRRAAKSQREIKLSDFQLLDKLGKGAFGDVYMAQQKNIGFICVIKKMSKKRIRDTQVQQHILRQIKIQSYLNHPNLTALFGYFHDEQFLYLVLQALPDGSLQQVKKKRKLPEKQTAAIVKQVSEGLKYMHQQYIIHRDLKPQNLFVNQGFIKIGDFGCSIYNHDSGLRTTVVGCLEYSSPEQLSKEGYSDKIDSWSLGILTYELLFGKSPFQSDIIKITKNKDQKAQLSDLSFPTSISVSDDVKDFIQNLLDQNPDKRMDMDQVLIHPFLQQQMAKKPLKFDLF